ncbi:large ribosomal subunit protein bL19cz-like [Henckelia pumila]|uniref:large ribosomal subunit protein bL19cz-like n=2 Tax=Henckelia pumila TaxID=405737 RepID=UPI003C6E84BE
MNGVPDPYVSNRLVDNTRFGSVQLHPKPFDSNQKKNPIYRTIHTEEDKPFQASIMASNVLLQAPFMVPRAPKTLAFSAAVSRHPSAAALISTSCSRKLSLPKLSKSRSFVVRAEANAEVEVEDSAEAEVTQIVVASEEKSPRKPRIKLGDIMGILNKKAIEAADTERPTPDLRTGDVVEIKLEV